MEPVRSFAYLWAFLRAAERTTRQRPSKAGDVVARLCGHTFPQLAPDHAHPEKNRSNTGTSGAGTWIGRDVLAQAYRDVFDCETPEKANRLAANFLGREKSPVGPLTDFVRSNEFDDLIEQKRSIDSFLKPSDRDFLLGEFGVDARELQYEGVPIIGSGLPRLTLWFGVSQHKWLWYRTNEERAAALAFPIRLLPELELSWSPLGEWRPPSGVVSQVSREYQLLALVSYASAAGITARKRKVGKERTDYMHGTLDGVSGYIAAVAIQDWKGPQDVGALTSVLDNIRTSGEMRPDILLLCSGLEDQVVASEVHRFQATSPHPLHVFHTSIAELHATVRHLPWLWYEFGPEHGSLGIFSSREVDVGAVVRFASFLDYWRLIAPDTARNVLERCSRDLLGTRDFATLADALVRANLLPEKWKTPADLLFPSFISSAPTKSPVGDLVRAIEDWMLAHDNVFGDTRRAVSARIGRFNERFALNWDVDGELGRTLLAHRSAADDDDAQSLINVATLTLRIADVSRGLVLIDFLWKGFQNALQSYGGLCSTLPKGR